MSQSMEERVAKAMAHLKATEEAVAKAEAEMLRASETARSSDRSVKVTVGAKGELTAVEFLDGKYRSMAAQQLAAAVLEASNKARAEMARRVMDLMEPLTKMTPTGMTDRTGVDWDRVFGSLTAGIPGMQQPTAMSRLRDEIDEDAEEQVRSQAAGRTGESPRKGR